MGQRELDGRRVLVVGASAGIGAVIGRRLAGAGARVAFAARRGDVCQQLATAAGHGAIGLSCDVTDEGQCATVVAGAVQGLGGLDDVVYSAGAISLVALAEADADWWRRTFDTNVLGAALVTRAALPHLTVGAGSMVYLSSVSSVGTAWPGLGVYSATKSALNRMVEAWRSEHPEVGFARVFVGPTGDAGTGTVFDASAMSHMARWPGLGVQSGVLCTPDCISEAVELVLTSRSRVWDVTVVPKDPPLPWNVGPGGQVV